MSNPIFSPWPTILTFLFFFKHAAIKIKAIYVYWGPRLDQPWHSLCACVRARGCVCVLLRKGSGGKSHLRYATPSPDSSSTHARIDLVENYRWWSWKLRKQQRRRRLTRRCFHRVFAQASLANQQQQSLNAVKLTIEYD